ncbi:MAG: hypothetical protein Q9174_001995 [Haloplaca sp. 1 TL-2023]
MNPQSPSGDGRPALQPHSCAICQRRKVKCDKTNPCGNCVRHRVECEYRAPAPPKRRKRTSPDPEIHAKLRRYEEVLQKNGVRLDEINGIDEQRVLNQTLVTDRTKSEASRFKHLEELLEDSDGEGSKPGPGVIQRAYDTLYGDGSGLLLGFSVNDDLRRLHPQPITIFRLWQTYLNSVYPLTMLFHAPTIQQKILDACADLDNVSETMEALMFAIYFAAVVALSPEECEKLFGQPQPDVVTKYMLATQQALNAAKLLKNTDIMLLQALVILLTASRHSIDPRSLWIHCGTAVRLGQRIGLHRDGSIMGLPSFETEMRRRLWWQIVLLDARVAETSGSGTPILFDAFDTHLPSNVNDSNLSPGMGEMPPSHQGATDMIFCLARCEVADCIRKSSISLSFDGTPARPEGASVSLAEKDAAIDELTYRLEEKYLRHCDAQLTLHFLTTIFTQIALWRMRLVAHHPRHYADRGASMPQTEKDLLYRLSLNMIENDNVVYRNKSADKFAWFVNGNFQLPAVIYLLSELRYRTRGELCERGWDAIAEGFQNRIHYIIRGKSSPMFQAMSALVLKAWQARTADASAHGEPAPTPAGYILALRSTFGEPPSKGKKSVEDNHTNQGAAMSTDGATRAIDQLTNAAGGMGTNGVDGSPAQLGVDPSEWSPMDWTYWDELIASWQPQLPDNGEQFDFGQSFNLGRQQS